MDLSYVRRVLKWEYLILLLVMGLAFYIAYIPNLNYPYPVHMDEWTSLAYFEAISQSGNIQIVDPFYGQEPHFVYAVEMGFHLFWSIFHQISGVSFMTIIRYFPGVIFIITVLSVYILAQRKNFGWEAALFTCLIITTVGILGPAFLVTGVIAVVTLILSYILLPRLGITGAGIGWLGTQTALVFFTVPQLVSKIRYSVTPDLTLESIQK